MYWILPVKLVFSWPCVNYSYGHYTRCPKPAHDRQSPSSKSPMEASHDHNLTASKRRADSLTLTITCCTRSTASQVWDRVYSCTLKAENRKILNWRESYYQKPSSQMKKLRHQIPSHPPDMSSRPEDGEHDIQRSFMGMSELLISFWGKQFGGHCRESLFWDLLISLALHFFVVLSLSLYFGVFGED